MGLFSLSEPTGLEQRMHRNHGYETELKRIKAILKSNGPQQSCWYSMFHSHIKPPVEPPMKFLVKHEMVSGKKIPFTVTMAMRTMRKYTKLGPIPEMEDAILTTRAQHRRQPRSIKMVKMGTSIKLLQ